MNNPKTALVTGGTFGIGRATATALARQGLEVVITGRDQARAAEAVNAIKLETGNQNVSALLANFFVPAQVKMLAEEFLSNHSHLEILVNNAGGNFTERKLIGGFERTWVLNHLAYVNLSLALLPILKSSAPSRIVNVASGWYASSLDFNNLQGERQFNGQAAYTQSKLANHLFTYALTRRLEGTGVTVNAINPGMVDTGLIRGITGWMRWLIPLMKPLQKTPEQGAFPSIHMATSSEVEGVTGNFFNKTKFVEPTVAARDETLQEKLWKLSLEQLGLSDSDFSSILNQPD
jgi:NAD(P)-dependent dehydrogenase (short-subunit alcohol dehydrogenase family)